MPVKEIASTSTPVLVEATSEAVVSQIWFKTDPIDRLFCYHAQLQLQIDSSDQDHETGAEPGSWRPALLCGDRPPWRMVVQVASLWEVKVHA